MFIVPYLVYQGLNIKKAIGISSSIGFPLALSGAFGYMINGWALGDFENSYTLGFLFIPAIVFVSIASFLSAPIGVRLAHKLSTNTLKKVFSLIPFVLSIKLMYEIF